jgi:cell division protein FtsN
MQTQDSPTNRLQLIQALEDRFIPVWSPTGPIYVQVQNHRYPTWYGRRGNLLLCEVDRLERWWRESRDGSK